MQTRLGRHGTALTGVGAAQRQAQRVRPQRRSARSGVRVQRVRPALAGIPAAPLQGRRADRVAAGQHPQRGLDDRPHGRACGRRSKSGTIQALRASKFWPSGHKPFAGDPLGRLARRMYQSSILAQDSGSGGSSLGLLFFLIIPVAMYFLMIRPQRKRHAAAGGAPVGDRDRRRGRHQLRHLRVHHGRGRRQVLARDRRERADPHRQGGDPGQGRRDRRTPPVESGSTEQGADRRHRR